MPKLNIEKQDSVKLYKIRKTLQEISKFTGRGTELITVYIPKGKRFVDELTLSTLPAEANTIELVVLVGVKIGTAIHLGLLNIIS